MLIYNLRKGLPIETAITTVKRLHQPRRVTRRTRCGQHAKYNITLRDSKKNGKWNRNRDGANVSANRDGYLARRVAVITQNPTRLKIMIRAIYPCKFSQFLKGDDVSSLLALECVL